MRKLIEEFKEIKDELAKIKEQKKELQKKFDEYRFKLIPEAMEEAGLERATFDGIGTVYLTSDIYFSIPAPKKEDAFRWLHHHGHGDLITETVNASSGKAWAKEMLQKGEQLPEDLFKITPYTRAVLKKG